MALQNQPLEQIRQK